MSNDLWPLQEQRLHFNPSTLRLLLISDARHVLRRHSGIRDNTDRVTALHLRATQCKTQTKNSEMNSWDKS